MFNNYYRFLSEQLAVTHCDLQSFPGRTDFLEFERWLLPRQLSFIPGLPARGLVQVVHIDSSVCRMESNYCNSVPIAVAQK
jgi:hypothetical protein